MIRIWFILPLLLALAWPARAESPPADAVSATPTTGGFPSAATEIPRGAITDRHCLECHGVAGYAVPIGVHGDTPKRGLFVDGEKLKGSAHGRLTCLECHADLDKLPHTAGRRLDKVDCVTCHQNLHRESDALLREMNQGRAMVGLIPAVEPTPLKTNLLTRDYAASLHGRLRTDGSGRRNAECRECHGSHDILPATSSQSPSHRLSSPAMCGSCHPKALEQYRGSVHGAALQTPWKGNSAVCGDCHPSHRIESSELPASWKEITENCGACHQDALASYLGTYHGQLAWLGGKKAAKCSDCHDSHATRHTDDPADKAHTSNLLTTCRKCHKEATESFIRFQPHANTWDFARYPWMWLAGKAMVTLVLGVLAFFYLHSWLWFRRTRNQTSHDHAGDVVTPGDPQHSHVQRFSWPWRLNHWLLALSVMALTLTGMTAKYADTFWAQIVAGWAGDPATLAMIHRGGALVFLLAVGGHVVAALFQVLVRRKGEFRWFGPDSLLPRKQDWLDMKAQFRWFLGKGEAPRFDRWTYWEKFDYWAVYWGALVVGLSGLMLWFPGFFARFLPGWVFNLANLLHGVEAFLAVTTLFVVHFFNNHFRPGKFPLDVVMFTGSWSLEAWAEERPEEYRRLLESGRLAERLVAPPSRMVWILSHVAGFALIGFGLLLLFLVMVGFLHQGLV